MSAVTARRRPAAIPDHTPVLRVRKAPAPAASAAPLLTVEELVHSCLPLAHRRTQVWASRFPSLDIEEIRSEALFTLLRAAKAFDQSRGVKFITYAYTAIDRNLARWCVSERTRQQHAAAATRTTARGEDIGWVAVLNAVDCRRVEDERPPYWSDWVRLWLLMDRLSDRMRQAIEMRCMWSMTFAEVGGELGVSRERARQMVAEGLQLLKLWMLDPQKKPVQQMFGWLERGEG